MIATNFGPHVAPGFGVATPQFNPNLMNPAVAGFRDGYAGASYGLGGGQFTNPAVAFQQLQLLSTLLSVFSGLSGGATAQMGGQFGPGLMPGWGAPQFAGPQFGGFPGGFPAGPQPGAFPGGAQFGGFPVGPQPGFPGQMPNLGQGFQPGAQGPGAVRQLISNPKSLGQGAGMRMLPPDAPPEAFKQALEQRFGMPFEQIREQYAQGKQDPKLKKKGAINKVGPAELYKQIMVESEFGKISLKGHDGKVGGQGKLSGTRASMKQVNESYSELFKAKGGANANAEGAAGSSVAISMAVSYMTQQGVPVNLAISVAMSETGQASGNAGVQDQAAYAKAKAAYEAAVRSGTPILLDLAGTGVPPVEDGEWKPHPHKFTAKNKRMFDLDADGVKELVEWVNPGGALLCQPDDRQDVPNGKHLFGDAGGFKDGYAKLARLDADNKGYVSLEDMERNNIQVWVDETGDALVTEGELKSCRELGISKIYTAHTDFKSTFVQDGEEKATWDWWPSYRKLTVGARA